MNILEEAKAYMERRDKTPALTNMRHLRDMWRSALDATNTSADDPDGAMPLEIIVSDMPVFSNGAFLFALAYEPVRPAEWPVTGDDCLPVALSVDPLNIALAHCEMPDGAIFELLAGPVAYTMGRSLDDHIAYVEKIGEGEMLSRSIRALREWQMS